MRPAGSRPLSALGLAGRSSARLLRDAARLDRTQSDPVVALRNAVGIGAPLAIGALVGNAPAGLAATIGAIQAAFADRPGPYRLRVLRMLLTAFAAAVTSAAAIAASGSAVASVALLVVLAFGAGLLLTAGPSATQVGTAGVAAAIILGHLHNPISQALPIALLVLAGGAGQAVLAVAGWPLGRHRPERMALATLYRALADAARTPAGTAAAPPAGETLSTVRRTFYGLGHDHGPSVEAYLVLLDEGERLRRELLVVTAAAERLARDGDPILAGLVRGSLTAAGDVLAELADALEHARAVDDAPLLRARATIRHTVERLEAPPGGLTRRATAGRLRAMSGQLRAAVESTRTGASEGREPEGPRRADLRDPFAILSANLRPDSAVLRHAVRVALLVAGADAAVRALGVTRGYWVSLTVLVVLRPDFGATLQRSVMRTIGTVLGLLAATALLRFVPGEVWWQVGLIALFAFGMRLAGPGNVALSAVALSALVVILLEIEGTPARQTLDDRSLATLAGGALAILASLALPSWERDMVRRRLGDLLAAYRAYLATVAGPAATRDALDPARTAARRARTNAQASVDRAQAEPVHARGQVELGRAVLAHTHRLVHAVLTLDALAPSPALDEAQPLLAAAVDALARAEASVRTGATPASGPRLRPLADELAAEVATDPDGSTLADATDRLTNSLDTLLAELRRQHDPAPAPSIP